MRISDWSSDVCSSDLILIEVETDKVVLEVPAPASGVLKEIVKGDGSTVTAGEVLARIDSEGKAAAAAAPAAAVEAAPAAAAPAATASAARSEERRGGKESVRTCRSRWSQYH